MNPAVREFLEELKSRSFALVRGELIDFLEGLKEETSDFAKKQRAKLEKLMLQLATKKITKRQFKEAIEDMKLAADAEATLHSVKTKAAAQRLSDGLTKLVINGLIKVIPG